MTNLKATAPRLLIAGISMLASLALTDMACAQLKLPTGAAVPFPIEAFARHCLMNGIDELGFLRSNLARIESYEAARPW